MVKTHLALSHKKSQEANVLLLEEPENHLSHTKLNELIRRIGDGLSGKQMIISTHSSFVANKLGLDSLLLLHAGRTTRLNQLSSGTKEFFEKLAGYDTLRLILCRKALLVEGDSDELVVQKAYMQKHSGRLPIQDGIDVISVGTSFLRFLEIADRNSKPVAVITDNDGDVVAVERKYASYLGSNQKDFISIHFDADVNTGGIAGFNYNTLEPNLLKANGRAKLNLILGTSFATDDDLLVYMRANKTDCALKIYDTTEQIVFPPYIEAALT